jgi:ribosomal protein S18 acetylase RimI-like enzyme
MASWCQQADSTAAGTDRCTFLAFSDNSPVGIAAIYRNNSNEEEGEIVQVWVSPSFRGSKVSRELLHTAIRWCEENGIRKIFATIRPGNDRALKFYRKYEFDWVESKLCNADGTHVLVRGSKS